MKKIPFCAALTFAGISAFAATLYDPFNYNPFIQRPNPHLMAKFSHRLHIAVNANAVLAHFLDDQQHTGRSDQWF